MLDKEQLLPCWDVRPPSRPIRLLEGCGRQGGEREGGGNEEIRKGGCRDGGSKVGGGMVGCRLGCVLEGRGMGRKGDETEKNVWKLEEMGKRENRGGYEEMGRN